MIRRVKAVVRDRLSCTKISEVSQDGTIISPNRRGQCVDRISGSAVFAAKRI
jgi:hypothetical protein